MAVKPQRFVAEFPPTSFQGGGSIQKTVTWAYRNLVRVQDTQMNVHDLDILVVEPTTPREGMVRYADGTAWDPGSGKGPYCYNGSTWVALF